MLGHPLTDFSIYKCCTMLDPGLKLTGAINLKVEAVILLPNNVFCHFFSLRHT